MEMISKFAYLTHVFDINDISISWASCNNSNQLLMSLNLKLFELLLPNTTQEGMTIGNICFYLVASRAKLKSINSSMGSCLIRLMIPF